MRNAVTWVKASLAVNVVESTGGVLMCVYVFGCQHVWRPAYISAWIHLCTRACGPVCVTAWGVHECISCVFVLLVLQRWLWNDGNRHYRWRKRGYQTGGRTSHRIRTAAAPTSFNSSPQPDPERGQLRSTSLLPLSLSFHHLPPSLCWQRNFLFSLCTLYSWHQL